MGSLVVTRISPNYESLSLSLYIYGFYVGLVSSYLFCCVHIWDVLRFFSDLTVQNVDSFGEILLILVMRLFCSPLFDFIFVCVSKILSS